MFAFTGPYTRSVISVGSLSEALRKYQEVPPLPRIKWVKTDFNPLRQENNVNAFCPMACRPAAARPNRTDTALSLQAEPATQARTSLFSPGLCHSRTYAASQCSPQASSLSETLMASRDHSFLCTFWNMLSWWPWMLCVTVSSYE